VRSSGEEAGEAQDWLRRRTFAGAGFDPEQLAARKAAGGLRVSVALPARDVEDTVGPIVEAVRARWTGPGGLVDEVVVIDSDSSDDTARAAAEAGAEVHRARDVLPELGRHPGKGEALWKSLAVTAGDLVVWLDADLAPFDPDFVPGLLGPLLHEPAIGYVKGFYRRDLHGRPGDGGRVTEICARPLIALFAPELAGFVQPLAGEAAGRRDLLAEVPFFTGYAVEMGLLLDLERRFGLGALAQVDLGERAHAHQATPALGRMAHEITRATLARLAAHGRLPEELAPDAPFLRPDAEQLELESDARPLALRPPFASLGRKDAAPARHSAITSDPDPERTTDDAPDELPAPSLTTAAAARPSSAWDPSPGRALVSRGNGGGAEYAVLVDAPAAGPDLARAERAVAELMDALGLDRDGEAMRDTPRRVASAYAELLTPEPFRATTFPNDGGYDELVMVSDISFSTLCEHHLLPFVGVAHVAYLPGERIVGLSKLPRLVEHRSRRPQVQERLTAEIADWIERTLRPKGVGVVLEASHSCMSLRGVRQPGAITTTSALRGRLREDPRTRQEFLELIGRRRAGAR
jgi:glucosyl-3-phosphoglycerate synthase